MGCGAPLPLERWQLLNESLDGLKRQEAAAYIPKELETFEARVLGIANQLQADPALDLRRTSAGLSRELDQLIGEAADLERRLCYARDQLQRRQEQAVAFFREQLERADYDGYFPELRPLVERLEANLDSFRPFEEPGTYARNLTQLEEAEVLFDSLSLRSVRYSGDEVPTAELKGERASYLAALEELRPQQPYVVVDTALNQLSVRRGDEVPLEAVCSIGSGRTLVADGHYWEFATPRGEFTVRRKIREPSWRKPDWAFLEEGEPVPRREEERIEQGTLGAFAFEFADGYFIHGTLYKRLVGQPVTHGCIRLGSHDLLQVAALIDKGSKVLIF